MASKIAIDFEINHLMIFPGPWVKKISRYLLIFGKYRLRYEFTCTCRNLLDQTVDCDISLTRWPLIHPERISDPDQHRFRYQLGAWRHQAITWISDDLSSVYGDIYIQWPSLIQVMAWCRSGTKPLPEPIVTYRRTYRCIFRGKRSILIMHLKNTFSNDKLTHIFQAIRSYWIMSCPGAFSSGWFRNQWTARVLEQKGHLKVEEAPGQKVEEVPDRFISKKKTFLKSTVCHWNMYGSAQRASAASVEIGVYFL